MHNCDRVEGWTQGPEMLWELTLLSSHPTAVPGAHMLLPHLEGKQRGGK